MRGRGSNQKSRANLIPGGNMFNRKIWYVWGNGADGTPMKLDGPFPFKKAMFVSRCKDQLTWVDQEREG